jgi:hypothetical protein
LDEGEAVTKALLKGWKSIETAIAEGQRIQYHFVKPHMALEGQTPAERAGINIPKGKGRRLDLLELALADGKAESDS